MVWAAPALAAATLCLRVSTDPVKATAAVLIVGAVLSGAEHPRDPSSWAPQSLHPSGPLNRSTAGLVAEAAREDFRRSIAAASLSQGPSQREKSPLLLRALAAAAAHPRLPRSEERCPEPVTASNIDDTVPYLTPARLRLCLSSDVLVENLEAVLDQPLTPEALWVLKQKVDERFPSGVPEEQLRRLGVLSRLYTAQEISQWPVTTSDTLSALLDPSGGQWDDSQVQQLLSRYLALGGSWTGPLLQEMGGEHLCMLQEEQIQQIPAGAIGTAGQLNISACSQTKKEQLYRKAREAFASLASTPGPYYCHIQPYLGGAPAKDLKDLANAGVAINMDLDTFLALNPEELQKLSVTDVKHLLGKNLPELKKAEQEPSVVSWVQKQSQRELDCVLGIGLQGGLPEPTGTASPAGPTSPASATSLLSVTTPVPTTPASATSLLPVTTPVSTSPASATSLLPVTTPVSTSPASATSPLTVTTPVPTSPASATSLLTVPTSPHPATSANVTPASPTLLTIPSTSASVTSASVTSMSTVPTPTAISSHSTPQPSTVPPQTPTPSTLSPAPPDTLPHTGGPPVPPVPTATPPVPPARPALSTAAPCSTPQAPTTDRATSPAVTLLSTLLATSSPSAAPVPSVTSRATTGTNLAGTTHSTATPVPNSTSVPTVTSVPNSSSSPTATPVPNSTSVPTSTPVPPSPSVPAATTAPHTPTPIPNSTISTPKPLSSSPARPEPCQPSSPPGPPSPSSSPRPTPGDVPESPRPTSNGYINLQPEPGSGARLCSCLVPLLAATTGPALLRGLL